MSFSDFLRVLRARWILATAIFVALTSIALVGSLVWPKKYTAKAVLMIDLKVDPVAGTSATGIMPSAAFLATQVDIIESNHVAQKVIKNLQLDDNALMRTEWDKSGAKGDYIAWLSRRILNSLKVEAARESNVVEISYEATEPKFAEALANNFAKAYIDSTVQFKTTPAKQYSDFFEERANLARQKLEAAQNKLSEAQQSKGILVTDEKLDTESIKLNDLSAQLTALRGALADSSSRRAQAMNNGDVSPDAMASTLLLSLRSDLSRSEAKLDESLERYGENHPIIVELRASIASIKDKIRRETGRVGNSLTASSQINQSKEATILAAYNEQRDKLLKLKQDRNELLVIEREVGAAQRVYDAIQARQSQMNLEGSNSQNNIVVLNTASEPVTPSSPKIGVNTLIGAVLGAIIAAFVTMVVELADRKVRSTSDLVTLLRVPVIGYLTASQRAKNPWSRSHEGVLYPLESIGMNSADAQNPNAPGRLL
ncbi:MAG: chain length determinant protein EpsF [Aquabacterium sp.]|uniref:chain length determinant protein EpsF n=1 Tax=Aquabacterium sp. TaxID=1872578 RepID=UPI0025BE42DA|nr:chain length determinant protein EpsF [Aquabacterium sp.]MBI5926420.1 chain length determinant protein EpsF [Aquabacterium sp.]